VTDPAIYRERQAAAARARHAANRAAVFGHYGRVCACPGCGETERLTIDHVNGGGGEHLRQLGFSSRAQFYVWLVAQGFPDDPPLQTMCDPCNNSKGTTPACRIDHAAPPGWQRCTDGRVCGGQTLPPTAFHRMADSRDGRHPQCRECRNAAKRAARAAS
jgi:hypothetical protein